MSEELKVYEEKMEKSIVFLFNEYGFNHVIKCRTLFNAFNPAIAL